MKWSSVRKQSQNVKVNLWDAALKVEYVMTSGAAATEHVEKEFENEKDDLQVNVTRADRLDIVS